MVPVPPARRRRPLTPPERGRRPLLPSDRPFLTGDYVRQYSSATVALLATIGILASYLLEAAQDLRERSSGSTFFSAYFTEVAPLVYLVFWLLFAVLYCVVTHWAYVRLDSARLHAVCAAQYRAPARWWHSALGSVSAESWTMSAASVAACLTILIATTGMLRDSVLMILLGFGTVAGSWAMMVYSFALRYARIRASGQRMDIPVEDAPVFADFLAQSIFVCTLIGGYASLHTREAWTAQRSHTVLAFAFNTVIVAMSVTLLFGGIAG